MTLIDEKGRLFGRVNVIDIAIILIIITVGFVAAKFIFPDANKEVVTRKIEYDVELLHNTRELAEMIKIGDEIRDSVKGEYLGKIIKTEIRPTTMITANTDEGRFIKAELPNLYDVIITLEASGKETENSIIAEGQEIKVGKRMYVKGKGYAGAGYILGIKAIDKN